MVVTCSSYFTIIFFPAFYPQHTTHLDDDIINPKSDWFSSAWSQVSFYDTLFKMISSVVVVLCFFFRHKSQKKIILHPFPQLPVIKLIIKKKGSNTILLRESYLFFQLSSTPFKDFWESQQLFRMMDGKLLVW
jgi:hypothetical protein